MGGDNELDVGEGFGELTQYQLLPAWVQVHVHLVDQHDTLCPAGGLDAEVGIELGTAVSNITHHGEHIADAITELLDL